jgi:4-amino-4-deoxy-L-arabinose transferase-like glycosyltransferase
VPAFALAYLVAGPPKLGRRIGQLLLAGLALVASAGWYIAIVELVPASMRPYIGGSQNNSLLELTLGYNGLGRLNGNETGSVGGGRGWGEAGWLRMFDAAQGGQISWLLPAALILLVVGLAVTARAPRTDRVRAGFVLWGGWLLVTVLVFSFMQGIFHAYYTVALAPAVGAVVGMGAAVLWRRGLVGRIVLAAAVAVTAWWSFELLGRSASFVPWLRWVVLVAGLLAAVGFVASARLSARIGLVVAGVALAAVLGGPAAYAVQTASEPHTGSIPSAGPVVAGGGFGPGGGRGVPGGGRGMRPFPGGSSVPGGSAAPSLPSLPGGGGSASAGGLSGSRGGGMGGLLDAATVSDEMKALLETDADAYTWVAAAVGSQSASGYQLATGEPVMAIGGFNGSDPSPTLEQFQQYVAAGEIHYFIGGGGFGGRGGAGSGSNASSQIAEWVAANYTARTIGGVTVYDLTS